MKIAVNELLKTIASSNTKAFVLDAETLLSSKALTQAGVAPENIVVANTDYYIIQKAKELGHVHSLHGATTNVVANDSFDIIYLDYCGSPYDKLNGVSPQVDLWWAAANLTKDGTILCTFSKRAPDAAKKALSLVPSTLNVCVQIHYHETSAMFFMILTQTENILLKKTFYRIYGAISTVERSTVERSTVERRDTIVSKKRKREEYKSEDTVNVRWGDKVYAGTVVSKGRNLMYHKRRVLCYDIKFTDGTEYPCPVIWFV